MPRSAESLSRILYRVAKEVPCAIVLSPFSCSAGSSLRQDGYWRSSPSVLSLVLVCQGEAGSQKWTFMSLAMGKL